MSANIISIFDVADITEIRLDWRILVGGIVILLVVQIAYNIFLHPLSSHKGPTYLAASNVPLAYLQLRGTSQYIMKKAHDKYGPVIRISPNTLSYIDPSAWDDIYGYRQGISALPKDPDFYNEMLLAKDTITIVNDEDAKPIRRALNAAFSPKVLLEQETMLRDHIETFFVQVAKRSHQQESVDVRQWIHYLFFDILSDFAFGEDLGCVKQGKFHEWAQFVVDYFYAATLIHQCHKFWPLNELLALMIPPAVKRRKECHTEASLHRVRRRIARDTGRSDFMSNFLRQARKERLSRGVIEAQASVITLAGSETSGVALVAAIYYVVSDERVHRKLREEVRTAFDGSAEITLPSVSSKLPYLDACVKETLRMHPPLANGFTRVVANGEGARISGGWVPPNTVVTINHYCASWSAKNFRDAESFVPERWLGDPAYADDRRSVVQPFSVGPRDCPGKQFALNNIRFTLAKLIWTFDVTLDASVKDWTAGQKIFNGWQQPPLPVLLEQRVVL